MTIHTLDNQKHNNFLTQNRIDPITGDLLQENDRIVICAACKSAFLVDSWEYMDKKHCNQRLTLKEIPISEIVRMERPYLIDLKKIRVAAKYAEASFSATPYLFMSFFLCFVLYYFSFISEDTHAIQIAQFTNLIILAIFYVKSFYKSHLEIKDNVLFFDKKHSSKNSLKIEDIKGVEIYKSKRHRFMNFLRGLSKKNTFVYTLKIIAKNQQKYSFLLEHKELERIKTKTNLLQKFNKNLLPSLSVNSNSKEITE